jgi:hypothetical protein
LNLPFSNEIKEYFGGTKNQHEEIICARCSFAYDVCNELVLDAIIEKRRSCEKDIAVKHLLALNPNTDILVFDRGYPAQWLIGLLNNLGFKFCFRLSTSWKIAHKALNENDDINWVLKWNSHRALGKMKTYNIPKEIEGLRLLKIELSSHNSEVLLTNLSDNNSFSMKDMKELYRLRWGVEESFKLFKKTQNIEYFSSKTVLGIQQDFHAKVVMLNLATVIRTQGIIIKRGKTKHLRQVNKTQALAKIRDFLIDLFYSDKIRHYIELMLKFLCKSTDIIRLNRTFPRSDNSARRRFKVVNYRGI